MLEVGIRDVVGTCQKRSTMSKYSTVLLAHLLPFLARLLLYFWGEEASKPIHKEGQSFLFWCNFLGFVSFKYLAVSKICRESALIMPGISIEGLEIEVNFMFRNFKHREMGL